MTEREINELNENGIRILKTKAIGYRGKNYDQLREVSKFEVYHWIVADEEYSLYSIGYSLYYIGWERLNDLGFRGPPTPAAQGQ